VAELRDLCGYASVVDRHRLDDSCWAVAWSRDGSTLLVSTVIRPGEPADLWAMDAVAGDPVRTVLQTDSINTLSMRPGDRDLVFAAGNPTPEFWILRGAGRAPPYAHTVAR
jgi:hypothetical protein